MIETFLFVWAVVGVVGVAASLLTFCIFALEGDRDACIMSLVLVGASLVWPVALIGFLIFGIGAGVHLIVKEK